MSLKLDLKNLAFTVFGGMMVATASYLFFSPSSEYNNRLTAEYRRAQISYAGSILGDKASSSLIVAKDVICADLDKKVCSEKLVNLAKKIRNHDYFQNRRYTVIHELTIRNETEYSVSDLEIEHSFSYPGYVIFEKNNKGFHKISNGSVFKLDELKPGKKVEAIFFSQAGYSATINNINVTESGKILRFKPLIEAPDGNDPFSEEISSIFKFAIQNQFTSYVLGMLLVLSFGLILLALFFIGLRLVFPEWLRRFSAKNMNKSDYLWQKSVLDLYEKTQKQHAKN